DQYIEIAKGRLYLEGAGKESASTALRITLDNLCRMFAPFVPYFAEECYSSLRAERVHHQPWVDFSYEDPESRTQGESLVALVSELRRYKHDRSMALNAPLGMVTIYTGQNPDPSGDVSRVLNAEVRWRKEKPSLEKELKEIKFNMGVIGPQFKKRARDFMAAVRALPLDDLIHPPATLMVDGEEMAVPANAFTPQFSYLVEGKKVDLLRIGEAFVTIPQSS
ncbi:MAG: class I tRNA ligase family protein, partial [Methanomicrobiales archaeon]|nr:class I tRNA ligase family protein [Methanomicrobiales archaeon]